MNEPLHYKFPELIQAADTLDNRSRDLANRHDDLKTYVSRLFTQEAWSSDGGTGDPSGAAGAYQAAQSKWDDAHAEMIHVLSSIASVVRNGAIDMQTTEDRNATSWV